MDAIITLKKVIFTPQSRSIFMIKSNSSTVLLMALGVMSFLVPETNDVALEVRKKYIPQFLPLTLKKEGQEGST